MTFTGGCDTEVFNKWLEERLLPELPHNTTIVLDNATFHKSPKTQDLVTRFACHLLYLPTYSPDLNPIEHCWHTIKSWLKPRIHLHTDLHLLVDQAIITVYHSVWK
jgi:transposase